jgi:hypothetical protein
MVQFFFFVFANLHLSSLHLYIYCVSSPLVYFFHLCIFTFYFLFTNQSLLSMFLCLLSLHVYFFHLCIFPFSFVFTNMHISSLQQHFKASMWAWACEHEPMSRNGYFWNILRTSLCHVRMTWKIFFHMYMDESHKMDEKFGWKLNINEFFGW